MLVVLVVWVSTYAGEHCFGIGGKYSFWHMMVHVASFTSSWFPVCLPPKAIILLWSSMEPHHPALFMVSRDPAPLYSEYNNFLTNSMSRVQGSDQPGGCLIR